MEHIEFIKYCKTGVVKSISANEVDGFTILFYNDEWISVHSGVDGLYYIHSSELVPDYTELRKELMAVTPQYIDKFKAKYGTDNFKLFEFDNNKNL